MEWTTTMKNVLRYIEEHLQEPIDINAVSASVYLSPFYLQKGFQIMTGYAIGEYIRNRRLYEAARELVSGNRKVLDVALRYGYETPESFTKAFTRFHGVTPSAVRKEPYRIRNFLPLSIKIEITGGNKMDYVVSPMWGFKVIGFEKIFSYEEAYAEIPKFWDEICERYCNHTIYAGLAPSCPQEQAIIENCIGEYGVCIDDVGGGKFRYLIAGRYTGGEIPEGMTVFEFPQGEWAKFECIGAIPAALQNLNDRVFKEWLPGNTEYEMAGYYNIEWYSCDGEKSDADYKSGIWVPIRRYQDEAKRLFGDTAEYAESERRTASRTASENQAVNDGLMELFARFGKVKAASPSSPEAQGLVAALQAYITEHFYPCSDEMLGNLGEMYVADTRFAANIDRMGGSGTAAFVKAAIVAFLST